MNTVANNWFRGAQADLDRAREIAEAIRSYRPPGTKAWYVKATGSVCYDARGVSFPERREIDWAEILGAARVRHWQWRNQFDWDNQPEVLCFEGTDEQARAVDDALGEIASMSFAIQPMWGAEESPPWVVQYNVGGEWENVWTEDLGDGRSAPQRFRSAEEARRALEEYLSDVTEAVNRGDMDEEYSREDFRVVRESDGMPAPTCRRCGTILMPNGRCRDATCPYSDRDQEETFTEG